jgi:uncharacterized protein YndB with AHSA1/START domain
VFLWRIFLSTEVNKTPFHFLLLSFIKILYITIAIILLYFYSCPQRGDPKMKHSKAKITALPGRQELFIERELDAPREIVFKAYTDPRLYAQWIGPRGLSTDIEKFEAKNGGMWRFIQKDKDGNEFAFHGVFHEVAEPERIIQTFEYEGLPETGHVSLEIARFEELPGDRTRVVSQAVFMSVEDRDGMMQSDMEWGVNEGFERLDELLEKEMAMAK